MALTDKQWTGLARDVSRALARVAPEWTDAGLHDPGITVLEALAYALTDLQQNARVGDERVRALARRIADRAGAVADAAVVGDDCGPGLQRVHYLAGRLLDVDDLRAEQDYLRQRLDRRNRLLHGAGIVDGLEVTVEGDAGAGQVAIAPGLAFDTLGREICLEGTATVALPADGSVLLVSLGYAERPCRRVAAGAGDSSAGTDDTASTEATRIVETYSAALVASAVEGAVTIARLRRTRGRWRIDATFKASRIHGG